MSLDIQNDTPVQEESMIIAEIRALQEEVSGLKDMFARRLYEDRQKNEMMKTLNAGATYAFIEPFLNDLILLLDRMEKTNDEFSISVYDELYDILNRRGVSRIKVTTAFDPAINKAVRVYESTEVETLTNKQIVRNGYTLSGKVIRPAEVIVEKPVAKDKESSE